LYGKKELLEEMPPFLHGGDMIKKVTLEGAEWNKLPWKFEAGTPAIVEGIGLGAAIDYLNSIGMEKIERYEQEITQYALEALSEVKGIKVYGPSAQYKGGIATFTLGINGDLSIHPEDIGYSLDEDGICIRTGLHCAHPLHDRLGVPAGTARASFYIYTTFEEIDKLVTSLNKVNKRFGIT
jgi:cysteine desulfurase/selenocysteine lyase